MAVDISNELLLFRMTLFRRNGSLTEIFVFRNVDLFFDTFPSHVTLV